MIDKNGDVVYTHFGEGDYDVTENKVRELLGLDKVLKKEKEKKRFKISPETYLGSNRAKNKFTSEGELPLNNWRIAGL